MASLCLISQYFSTLGSAISLEDGLMLIIYLHSIFNSDFSSIATCMSSIEVHMKTSTHVLMLYILMFMPDTSWSQFSTWLWCDSQSAMYSPGPGLYRLCILCWCIHNMMYCSHCDITTSLMIMATSGLRSVMTYTSLAKQLWWNLTSPWSMPSASLSIVLYCHTVLDRLLLAYAIGQRAALSNTSSCLQFIPTYICNKPVTRPMPDASVSK